MIGTKSYCNFGNVIFSEIFQCSCSSRCDCQIVAVIRFQGTNLQTDERVLLKDSAFHQSKGKNLDVHLHDLFNFMNFTQRNTGDNFVFLFLEESPMSFCAKGASRSMANFSEGNCPE